jgi:hypothetical protein
LWLAGKKGRKDEEATKKKGCFRIGFSIAFAEGVGER